MNFIKKYIKTRNIAFYVSLGFCLLSFISAIIYSTGLNHLKDYFSNTVTILLVVGPLIYVALSFFRLEKLGMLTFTLTNFAAFIVYVVTIYRYPVEKIMDTQITDIPEFNIIVASAALMLITIVAGSVFCWLKLRKTETEGK